MNIRNYTIDYIKVIAAIGVVMMHTTAYAPDYYDFNQYTLFINYVLRFAVPFFILTSGYFVRDNTRALVSMTKLYVLYLVVYKFFAILVQTPNQLPPVQMISWYFPAMLIILVITSNRSRWWTAFLIIISLFFDAITGRLGFIEPLIQVEVRSNALTFLWVFLLGRMFYETGFKIKSRFTCFLLLIIGAVLCLFNGIIMRDQYVILPELTAIILFTAGLTLRMPTMPRFMRGISMDLFIFHGVFLPLKFYFDTDSVSGYALYIIAVCLCAAITGATLRYLDKKFLGGVFY